VDLDTGRIGGRAGAEGVVGRGVAVGDQIRTEKDGLALDPGAELIRAAGARRFDEVRERDAREGAGRAGVADLEQAPLRQRERAPGEALGHGQREALRAARLEELHRADEVVLVGAQVDVGGLAQGRGRHVHRHRPGALAGEGRGGEAAVDRHAGRARQQRLRHALIETGRPAVDRDGEGHVEAQHARAGRGGGFDRLGDVRVPEQQRLGEAVERALVDHQQHHVRRRLRRREDEEQVGGLQLEEVEERGLAAQFGERGGRQGDAEAHE